MTNNSNNLKIDLVAQSDGNGKIFYVAKLKAPITIDCSNGVCFLVFTSEAGLEQLQIANDNKYQNRPKINFQKDKEELIMK